MNFIKYFDFLGTKPHFLIDGNKSCKTAFGGMLSICVSVSLFIGVVYFLNMLLFRINFVVSESEEYFPNSYVNWYDLEASIILLDRSGILYEDQERIYKVTAMLENYSPVIMPDGKSSMKVSFMPVLIDECNVDVNFPQNAEMWRNEKYINNSWCAVPGQNINITKPYGFDNFNTMIFWIHPCVNTTTKNDCYPPHVIERKLMNTNVAVRFKNFYFDHKQHRNMGIPYVTGDVPVASSTIFKRVRYTMKQVDYETDDGMFLPTSSVKSFINFENLRETVDFRKDPVVPGSIITISFNMHTLKKNIKKSYYKFQNMLADLGGLFKAVIALTSIINGYICEKIYYNKIIQNNIESLVNPYLETDNSSIQNKANSKGVLEKSKSSNFVNSQQMLNFNILRSNVIILKNKEAEVKNKTFSSSGNFSFTKHGSNIFNYNLVRYDLSFIETVFPLRCFRSSSRSKRYLLLHYKLRKFIDQQFNVPNLFKKLNTVDKLSLMLAGKENMDILNECVNPFFYDISKPSLKYIEAQKLIYERIGNNIMNQEYPALNLYR